MTRKISKTFLALAMALTVGCAGAGEDAGNPGAGGKSDTLGEEGNFPSHRELEPVAEPPDPFVMFADGSRVETQDDWWQRRRPELLRLFEHYVYGAMPAPERPSIEVTASYDDFLEGTATYKEVTLRFGPNQALEINAAVYVPNFKLGPAPVIMMLNKCGNQSLVSDPRVKVTERPTPACSKERGYRESLWSIQGAINRGYAVVSYHQSDADPDLGWPWLGLWDDGFHPHYQMGGDPESHWGAISAWAYGLHRVVDYLETDPDIDDTRIAVTGHSRRGKAALWAAVTDERIAMAIPHQSGTAGTTLSRSYGGEGLTAINSFFPHWFNNVFNDFNGCPERLPIDQHLLIAMMAPRPVLVTLGAKDCHSDPAGSIMAVKLASPVYEFLGGTGAQDLNGAPFNASSDASTWETKGDAGVVRFDSQLAWAVRTGDKGKHSVVAEDWDMFLTFAEVHFYGSPAPEPIWTTTSHECSERF